LGKYVNGRFYYGIKTGLNEAFVVDRATRDRLIAEDERSAEVLKPFLRGRDFKRWCVDYQDLWLIFTRRGIDITKYPTIYEYLLEYRERLTPGIEGGRKDGTYKWYEIQDNVAYYQAFETPKILYQEIATYQAFAWDNSHAYSNNKTFLIPGANFYLLSLLNSKIIWFFLSYIASKLQGGAYAMQTPYVTQIPIRTAPEADSLAMETLVQKCIDANGVDVEHWEAEIDNRMAYLYGLSDEEMKIIREE